MAEKIKISEMPTGKNFDDYPDDAVFILDEDNEDEWGEEAE